MQTAKLLKLRHSLAIRGFEPSRPSNESSWAAAEVLSQRVPGYVTRSRGMLDVQIASIAGTLKRYSLEIGDETNMETFQFLLGMLGGPAIAVSFLGK